MSTLPQPFWSLWRDGDLIWRKLAPAVYNLNLDGLLPEQFLLSGWTGSRQRPRIQESLA